MDGKLTFEELSEEYRAMARNIPNPIRPDLYKAMRGMLTDAESSWRKAKDENVSDTVIDGLRDRLRKEEQLAKVIIDMRVDYIFKHRNAPEYILTPEERELKAELDSVRASTVERLTSYVMGEQDTENRRSEQ